MGQKILPSPREGLGVGSLTICHTLPIGIRFEGLWVETKIKKRRLNYDTRQLYNQGTGGGAGGRERGPKSLTTGDRACTHTEGGDGKSPRRGDVHLPEAGGEQPAYRTAGGQRAATPAARTGRTAVSLERGQPGAGEGAGHLEEMGRPVRQRGTRGDGLAGGELPGIAHYEGCGNERQGHGKGHPGTAAGTEGTVAERRRELPEPFEVCEEPGGRCPCGKTRPRHRPRRRNQARAANPLATHEEQPDTYR